MAKGRELAALGPGARFEPIGGAGHLVQEELPRNSGPSSSPSSSSRRDRGAACPGS
ncbi:putative hydrolase [Streptomyces viridochromogenes Tue57]|uniref:Putative hydrolase n=1 Tax=Streptomyces viridochromogenes Tue57 TaxID=1160705 RepID=L8P2G8_STRVR|nr:putative hydrolase [Streptomyces viridochromogenes Tue57]